MTTSPRLARRLLFFGIALAYVLPAVHAAESEKPPAISFKAVLDPAKNTVTLTATIATKPKQVEFYRGKTRIGTIVAAPYQMIVDGNELPPGDHTFSACSYTPGAGMTFSKPMTVTIKDNEISAWTNVVNSRISRDEALGTYFVGAGPVSYDEFKGYATSVEQTSDTALLFSSPWSIGGGEWTVSLNNLDRKPADTKPFGRENSDYAIYTVNGDDPIMLFYYKGTEVDLEGRPIPPDKYGSHVIKGFAGPNIVISLARVKGTVVARVNGEIVCSWSQPEQQIKEPLRYALAIGKYSCQATEYDRGVHARNLLLANLRIIDPNQNSAPKVKLVDQVPASFVNDRGRPVSVIPRLIPLVSGAVFHANENIQLDAFASDSDGWVTKLEFFANGKLLGAVTPADPPYKFGNAGFPIRRTVREQFAWPTVPAGDYKVTVKVHDNLGASSVSPAVPITVTSDPTLTIVADCSKAERRFDKSRLLNVAQGAYRTQRNLENFTDCYQELSAAGIKRIRIDHWIYGEFFRYSSKDKSGKIIYDFSRTDKVILPMLDHGMEPLMCIMGAPLFLCPEGQGKWGNAVPTDLREYGEVIQALAAHYVSLGHHGWYWEFANEPENFSNPHWSTEEFIQLYRTVTSAILAADPTAKVGGAGESNPNADAPYGAALLRSVESEPSLPLDYFSYHSYTNLGGRTDSDWSNGYSRYETLAPELLLTEWNSLCTDQNIARMETDTNVGAASVARRMALAARYPKLRLFYFSAKDGWCPSKTLSGGFGLLTINNHRKAQMNLMHFVNSMGNELLPVAVDGKPLGDNPTGAIASRAIFKGKPTAVTVLAWNHQDVAARISLQLLNLPFNKSSGARLQVIQRVIDATHGNVAADYETHMGYAHTPAELCNPIRNEAISAAAKYTENPTLPPNSVTLWTLLPLEEGAPLHAVKMEETGPCNWAWAKPVTSSSSDESPQIGWARSRGNDAIRRSFDQANDGVANLGFRSEAHEKSEAEEWLSIDLGDTKQLTRAVLHPTDLLAFTSVDVKTSETPFDIDGVGFPVDFKIQGSIDGITWTDLASQTGYQAGKRVRGPQTFTLKPTPSKFIRLIATRLGEIPESGKSVYRLQLSEIELYDKDAPTKTKGKNRHAQ